MESNNHSSAYSLVTHRGCVNPVEGNQEADMNKKKFIDFSTRLDEAVSTLVDQDVKHSLYRVTAGAAIRCYTVLKRWADMGGGAVNTPTFFQVYRGTAAGTLGPFVVSEEESMYRAGVLVANHYQLPAIPDLLLDKGFGRLLAHLFSNVQPPFYNYLSTRAGGGEAGGRVSIIMKEVRHVCVWE